MYPSYDRARVSFNPFPPASAAARENVPCAAFLFILTQIAFILNTRAYKTAAPAA
jgi:hypothetical protein